MTDKEHTIWLSIIIFLVLVIVFLPLFAWGESIKPTFTYSYETGDSGSFVIYSLSSGDSIAGGELTEYANSFRTYWQGSADIDLFGMLLIVGYIIDGNDTLCGSYIISSSSIDSIWSNNSRTLTSLDEDSTTIDLNNTQIGEVITVVNSVQIADKTGFYIAGNKTTLDDLNDFDYSSEKVTLVDSSATDLLNLQEKLDTLQMFLMFKDGAKTFVERAYDSDILYFCYDSDTLDNLWDTIGYRIYYHIGDGASSPPDSTKMR